jgi:3-phenylpropionate/trans-cinnamate dioxygenase ferredoxin subunit
MSDWVRVAAVDELTPGSRRVVDVDGVAVAVFNLDGEYCAIEDTCTHDGGELASGELQGDEIVCPRHGARFNVRTGAVTAPPAYGAVASLPVRVMEGWVEVRDDRWD